MNWNEQISENFWEYSELIREFWLIIQYDQNSLKLIQVFSNILKSIRNDSFSTVILGTPLVLGVLFYNIVLCFITEKH